MKLKLTPGIKMTSSSVGHILDLYCVRLSNAAPFYENYAKVCFDAKHFERELNNLIGAGGKNFGAFFFKKSALFS